MAGDLNATEETQEAAAAGWIDAYRAARLEDAGYTCCIGELANRSDRTLDKRIAIST